MSGYYLVETPAGGWQIVSPLGQVVADMHGMGCERGRRDIETMLAALNDAGRRSERLRGLRGVAGYLSASGRPTEDDVRRLAAVVAALVAEVAR